MPDVPNIEVAAATFTHPVTGAILGQVNLTGILGIPAVAPTGLTGAVSASRYVGATASGAPASGTFLAGDFVIDLTGTIWICTTAGSPGTWKRPSGNPAAPASFAPVNPASTVSTTVVMMGLGATCAYTPTGSGKVLVTAIAYAATATAAVAVTVGGRFGTGTAPANGDAVTGTAFGGAADVTVLGAGTGARACVTLTKLLALTANTAYWFDLAVATANASDAATVINTQMSMAEFA